MGGEALQSLGCQIAVALVLLVLTRVMPAGAQSALPPFTPSLSAGQGTAVGPSALPDCQMRGVTGALLLVLRSDVNALTQLRPVFPGATICSYFDRAATRLGYADLDLASQWATYLSSVYGLPVLVVAPAVSLGQLPDPSSARYLVLVDPQGDPNTLARVRQLTGPNARYLARGQRTLIAAYQTSGLADANRVLGQLRRLGFESSLLDQQQVETASRAAPLRPPTPESEGPSIYRILVPRQTSETLAQARKLAPDAFERTVNGQLYIQVASYTDRAAAERNRSRWLDYNFSGTLIEVIRN